MTTLAHLSDLHLLEEDCESRAGLARLRLSYLTLGRALKPERRRSRALDALIEARASGADHLVITGDLTEDGVDAQFEVLASVLQESRWPAARVTLVPGNHDAYADPGAFARALDGPLSAYAATSGPGAATVLENAVVVPVSTAIAQHFARAAGGIRERDVAAVARAATESLPRGRATIVAMHHPPGPRWSSVEQWIDGLAHHARLDELLDRSDHVHVLHGHTHQAKDRACRPGAQKRIFSARAVIDGGPSLRLYTARHLRLWPEASRAPLRALALSM
jgi:3',5'-cyclic-AMP phosphodiesterase